MTRRIKENTIQSIKSRGDATVVIDTRVGITVGDSGVSWWPMVTEFSPFLDRKHPFLSLPEEI